MNTYNTMKTFYQFLEALSSHGGFTMPHGDRGNKIEVKGLGKKDVQYITGMYKKPVTVSDSGRLRGGIIAVLDTVLSRVKDFNFHIYFGKYIAYDLNSDEYFFGKNNIPKEDIVFIKSKSQGELLTPWIILHNMAHAVFQHGNLDSLDAIKLIIKKLIVDLSTRSDYDKKSLVWFELDKLIADPNEILSSLFNFASTRSSVKRYKNDKVAVSRVLDQAELVYEIFVSYLYGGGKLKRPVGDKLNKLTVLINQEYDVGYTENYIYELIDAAFAKIEKKIKKSLDYCRGKIIED